MGCETGVVNGTSRKNPQYTAPAALLSVLDVIIFVPRRSRGTAPTRPDARKAEARNATEKCMMLVVKLDWTGTTSRVNKGNLGSQGRALLWNNERRQERRKVGSEEMWPTACIFYNFDGSRHRLSAIEVLTHATPPSLSTCAVPAGVVAATKHGH